MKTLETLKIKPEDHSLGPDNAWIVLIEYADFQCPYCVEAEEALRPLLRAYDTELRFVYRHFPLTEIHEWAELAAVAAEAAAMQGRFWQMHSRLFELKAELRPEAITRAAEKSGLDMSRFAHDLASKRCRNRVARDVRSAEELGLNGTPSLFVEGELYDGPWEFSELSRLVAGLLRQQAA